MAKNEEIVDKIDNEEIVDEGHDPAKAVAQEIAATEKASKTTKIAKKRKGDKSNSEASHLTGNKIKKISDVYDKVAEMNEEELDAIYDALVIGEVADEVVEDIKVDFSEDLNALVESEATLSDEFKDKTAVIFEAAIRSKLTEEVTRMEKDYATKLDEEVEAIKTDLEESVNDYLDLVVETWMGDNELAIHAGLRTEISEDFMNGLKDLFTESYIEVPEAKVDLVDDLSEENDDLKEKFNAVTEHAIELTKELDSYKRSSIVDGLSEGLADTQVEKLKSLTENVDYEDKESFTAKVETIKESYFNKPTTKVETAEDLIEDNSAEAEVSDTMARYVSTIKTANLKNQ